MSKEIPNYRQIVAYGVTIDLWLQFDSIWFHHEGFDIKLNFSENASDDAKRMLFEDEGAMIIFANNFIFNCYLPAVQDPKNQAIEIKFKLDLSNEQGILDQRIPTLNAGVES